MKNKYYLLLIITSLIGFQAAGYATKRDTPKIEAHFSPHDNINAKLIQAINNAKKTIYAAVYMITDKTVADALIKAKIERKVDVQIITDKISVKGLGWGGTWGKADSLAQGGVPTFIYTPGEATYSAYFKSNAIMHNKFALFDKTIWTGSFNWTRSASSRNKENVIIVYNDQPMYETYLAQFEKLKTECVPCNSLQKKSIHLYKYSAYLMNKIARSIKQFNRTLKELRA